MSQETSPRFEANKKSTLVAYAIWFGLGTMGGHRFFLKRTGSAVVMLILFIISFATMWIGLGTITGIILVIWCLVDVFLIPGWVQGYNNALFDSLQASSSAVPQTIPNPGLPEQSQPNSQS